MIREAKDSIRCCKFEIVRIEGDHAQRKRIWRTMADEIRRVYNRAWQLWEVAHVRRGHVADINEWRKKLIAWHQINDERSELIQKAKQEKNRSKKRAFKEQAAAILKKRGDKPKLSIFATDKDISKEIYDGLEQEFRSVHGESRELVRNRVEKDLKKKGKNVAFPQWQAVLMGTQGRPGFNHPMPIPMKRSAVKLIPPDDPKGDWIVKFRVQRLDAGPGKRANSIEETVTLQTKSKQSWREVHKLQKMIDGEWDRKGSFLSVDHRSGKWFFVFAYVLPKKEQPDLDENKALLLFPGKNDPWAIRVNGTMHFIGGHGHHVIAKRRRLHAIRVSRNESYKYATQSRKGRGRKRASAVSNRLSTSWTKFCSDYNHSITTHAVESAARNGCGKLIYARPTDSRGDTRFLAKAGKIPDYRHYTGWGWYQVLSMLRNKATPLGIEIVDHEIGARKQAK